MTIDPEQLEALHQAWDDRYATLRGDLMVSRLSNFGETYYLVHDPINFKNHRLTVTDYRVVSHLRDSQTVGECFQDLVDHKILQPDDSADLLSFLVRLQRMGLLNVGYNESAKLYETLEKQELQKSRGRIMGFLSITIPLAHPDQFLERTSYLFAFLFSRVFAVVWFIAMITSGVTLWGRRADFYEPFASLLATENLVFMAVAFIFLKVWHELGHGYACKLLGGRVPEMGTIIMAGMPLAYVDASAAWRFELRRHRLVVMCGGMYFESLVALVAFWIWVANPNGYWASFAYQLIVMAGLTTVLFNANPLMKYDGYFIFCELLGVQNFRPRAEAELAKIGKFLFLGIRTKIAAESLPMVLLLLGYAVLAGAYKWTVTFSLAALLCTKLMGIGILFGAYSVSMAFYAVAAKTWKYLLYAEETKPVRSRAQLVLAGAIAAIVLGAFIPVPGGLATGGIVGSQSEWRLRAATPGFLDSTEVIVGQTVAAGEPLVQLKNDEVSVAREASEAEVQWQRRVVQLASKATRLDSKQALDTLKEIQALYAYHKSKNDQLTVYSPGAGRVTQCCGPSEFGRFVETGEILATVSAGPAIVRCWMTADQIASAAIRVGKTVPVRCWADGVAHRNGVVTSIASDGIHELSEEDWAMTILAGEALHVDPESGATNESLFHVDVELPDYAAQPIPGTRAKVLFARRYQPLAAYGIGIVSKFLMQLYAE